jgi:hypothetical protein
MNLEQLVRDTFHDLTEDAPRPAPDFADRVLRVRRRRRIRTLAAVAAATAAVIVTAVAVPALDRHHGPVSVPASTSDSADVVGHPDQSPPRDLIAAGRTAVSAYYTTKWTVVSGSGSKATRTLHYAWHLYNTTTGRYESVPWAYLDVAPGMRTAAVLEGPLPSKRVGLLDMATGKVTRWIDLDNPAGGVTWSPQGDKLAVTTYSGVPETIVGTENSHRQVMSRTGYYVVDTASGSKAYQALPQGRDGNMREDIRWSQDGSLVTVSNAVEDTTTYYDLQGRQQPAPQGEKGGGGFWAGMSPDGRLYAGIDGVTDMATGAVVGKPPVQDLKAWADNDRLIAWGCDPDNCSGKGEFANHLVLVDIGGKQVSVLSGFRKASATYGGRWTPLFTKR